MNWYAITRDKFMSMKERNKLLRVSKKQARVDMDENRRTWVTRYMVVHLAVNSGLRVSEIAALKIFDLHLNGKENYLTIRNGKCGRKRDVYVDADLVMHLQNYLFFKKKLWNESIDREAPVFTGTGGKHYTTTALHISF